LSFILAFSFFNLQAQEENRPSTHQMFLNQYKSWQKEHPEYFQPATTSGALAAMPLRPKTTPLRKEIFGYMPYWMLAQLNNIDYSLLSTIAYFDVEINGSGDVTTDNGWSSSSTVTTLINNAHAAGVRVVLCMTNDTASQISSIVNTPSIKKKVIDTLYSRVVARNGDGVNIDFEYIPSGNRDSVTSFMRDLATKFHSGRPGSHVSCAPTDFDFRQGDWDVKEISKFTEVLFMQGYGYGWSTAPIAEPVGLLPTGTYWGTINITTFINAVLAAAPDTSRIILGLPHFGYDWPTTSSGVKASTTGSGTAIMYPDVLSKIDDYGRQWDVPAMNPWYRYQVGTQWHQGWYDDAESMSKKYQFAENKKLGGVGMWSLGMDQANHDIWDALTPYATGNPPIAVPHLPRIASMTDASSPTEGKILFRWFSTGQSFVKGYRLFMSRDGSTWTPAAFKNENTITASSTDYTISGLGLDSSYYFKFVAVDSSGSHASDTSDTYGVHTSTKNRYLIVDGFDRYGGSGSWQKPQHDFVRYYGEALTAAGKSFDAAANEAVAAGNINLNYYSGVIWFVGDESTTNRTFNQTEQNVVKAYLEGGGKLFVTGSEIAYELIGRSAADTDDKAFFTNYFKATWGGDKADGSTVTGRGGQIFDGISATFGQTYPEDFPDYFIPGADAAANLKYTPSQIAGLNYSGTFGSSTKIGTLVYLGFPFETIASLAQRTLLMTAIVHYFETATSVTAGVNSSPGRFSLEQNFPNPFNPVTHFQFVVAHDEFVSLKIYDVLGKEVAHLVDEQRRAGRYSVRWDASNFSSGVYFYRLRVGEYAETRKLVLTK
jgi:spore germination protein YaaH